jgi:hypothetical protein
MPTPTFPAVTPSMPLVRRVGVPGRVVEFLDGSEQRWRSADLLNGFDVVFTDVPAADLATVVNFWATTKGAFDATWTFTDVDGTTYPHMGFDQDELTATENAKPGRFSFSLKMRQTAPGGAYAGTYAAAYPALPNGVYTQRPFGLAKTWRTTRNDLAGGPRYAWAEWGAARGSWSCEYPVLTSAEMVGRADCFVGAGGRLRQFSFTDPNDGSAHAKCRFDQDAIEMRNLGAGQWSTSVRVVEFF